MAASAIADVRREMKPRLSMRRLIPAGLFLFAALAGTGMYLSAHDMTGKITPKKLAESDSSKTTPRMTLAEFSKAAGNELAKTKETENLTGAFNIIARLWKVAPISKSQNSLSLKKAAIDKGLQLYRYNGNLGGLLRMDCPTMMELAIPGATDRRYIVLMGTENDRLLIAPPLLGRSSLTGDELEILWTGYGYIPWKNTENLSSVKIPGARGRHVKRLQSLLKEAGVYGGPLTAVFDSATIAAVKEFQMMQGIHADGLVGTQTLFLLYRKVDRFAVPGLVKKVQKETG
jgi:general secretion pathway protein A